ncbi:glutamate receptor 2.8-like [Henckelia pumila]|uniref:glutamate receptor 2.8-like n=1 Tax=Henckelia pumila TaxID=405737 RepID=UPI003C6DDBD2
MGVGINRTFQVGVILDFDSLVGRIGLTSLSLAMTDFYATNPNYTTRLVLHLRDSKRQVIDAAANALSLLKDVEVDAIIGPQNSAQASFVIGLGDKANVSIISFSATSPSLHPRSEYFLQTCLSDAAQVGAIAAIVGNFKWYQVVLIYEDSDYGNGIVSYLANAFQDVNARVSYRSVIPLTSNDDFLLQELYKMKTMQTRVFVVHLSTPLASKLFFKAKEAGMMGEGYAWIVTSGVMDLFYSLDSHVVDSMQGILGVKPLIPTSRKLDSLAKRWKRKFLMDNPDSLQVELSLYSLWAYDTFWGLAIAAERVGVRELPSLQLNTTSVNSSANLFDTKVSQTGPKILEAMSRVTFQGFSGKFRLVGQQLEPSAFQILNVDGEGEREVGIRTSSEGISSRRNLNGTNSSNQKLIGVMFPGYPKDAPRGWEVPVSGKRLRVGVPAASGFKEFVEVERDPETNVTKFDGCYIRIFNAVMKDLPYAVAYDYFPFAKPDGSSAGNYDNLTYQVDLGNYDAVVGDITITSKRSQYVDFTQPFTGGGVTITVKREDPNSKWIFLKPFSRDLWLTSIALFFLPGLALWILEHKFNHAYRGHPAQHAGMIFYFPFTSLVFAPREQIVSNLARFVLVVWMFVVLVLYSTFTASLLATLTVQKLSHDNYEIIQLKKDKDHVGCRNGSFICDFLQEHLKFNQSIIRPCETVEQCAQALHKGNEKGGINSVRPYTDLFLSIYGDDFTTVGQIFPTDGFAFGFPKGSPLVADVSRKIIDLMGNGKITELEKQCTAYDSSDLPKNTQLTLESFTVLYAITGGFTTLCLAIFVTTYLYKNRDFVQRIWCSSNTVWSKFVAICKHFDERDPKSFRGREEWGNVSPNLRPTSTVVPVSSEDKIDGM